MKRISAVFLILAFFATSALHTQAQTRPRRVGQTPPPVTTNPSARTTQSTSPSQTRTPVLQGANRPNGSPSSSQPARTDNGPEEVDPGDVIKVETTLVTLPVSVMDRDGKYIPNLRKEDFRLWEDGTEQSVAFFAAVDKPFSVVLLLDMSASTRFRIDEIQDAAITFVNHLRHDDRVMVVSFDDEIRVLADFSNDRGRLRDAIRQTRTGQGTKLYDAVDLTINQYLSRVSGRKAVVLFTDGVDTTSRHASYQSNIRDAEELDALIYPVQYDTYTNTNSGGSVTWPNGGSTGSPIEDAIRIFGAILGGNSGNNRSGGGSRGGGGIGNRRGGSGTSRYEYDTATRYLRDLAERTGARNYEADSTQNLSSAFAGIADELRRQYSLGYYPKNPAQAGQRRQIKVRVNQPNLAVRTRDTYVYPSGKANTTAQRNQPVLQRRFRDPEPELRIYR